MNASSPERRAKEGISGNPAPIRHSERIQFPEQSRTHRGKNLMNKFDQFVKHNLKSAHYIRYADDFVLLSARRECLESQLDPTARFLGEELKLSLHPDKVFIKTVASGTDFLGWVHFSDHRVLRT